MACESNREGEHQANDEDDIDMPEKTEHRMFTFHQSIRLPWKERLKASQFAHCKAWESLPTHDRVCHTKKMKGRLKRL